MNATQRPPRARIALVLLVPPLSSFLLLAQSVPTDVQLPGTQPLEVPEPTAPTQCDNCHGGYDAAVEPAHNWRGSMMAHASRDPLFWATLAVAEQDFDGSGDLCLRCHVPSGWLGGRSTPTDGSALLDSDAHGVSCGFCHRMANPDGSEHAGVQNPPFLANDEGSPAEAYIGSSMYTLIANNTRLGPYSDPASPHASAQSLFHRSVDFCGTCHDVSNPVVGDLAHNNGAMQPLAPGAFSGVPGAPVDQKAAFNNLPHGYGILERTFSEYKASVFPTLPVGQYGTLPPELQDGSIEKAYLAATAVRPDGRYADGSQRFFSCQTCHMPPVQGKGCSQNQAPVRSDLPLHDMTGGNYWMPDVILWMENQGTLRLGTTLSNDERAGLVAGKARALANLAAAASLEVDEDELVVTNLTGHKLITGYPEGRRMWLRMRWYDGADVLLREDGAYGDLAVQHQGQALTVRTLLDLDDPNTRVYQAKPGMTAEWANQLLALGYPASMALEHDRSDGSVTLTLGQLAARPAGSAEVTFHFVLNNTLVSDTRIPPFGMGYDEALARNCLPVPASQYGDPGPGGVFDHQDELELDPPVGAVRGEIELLYQPTSWEYIQFLSLANAGTNPFLAATGDDMLAAWLATGMAEPVVMASTTWSGGCPSGTNYCTAAPNSAGPGAVMGMQGSASVAANDLVLTVAGAVPSQPGILYYGPAATAVPFGDGVRCVNPGSAGFQRLYPPLYADGSGNVSRPVDLTAPPTATGQITSGSTWYFQFWYRDPAAGGSGFNLSDGLRIDFCP